MVLIIIRVSRARAGRPVGPVEEVAVDSSRHAAASRQCLRVLALVFFAAAPLLLLSGPPAHAQPAADSKTVLILGSSVRGGLASVEASQAMALGLSVEIASDEEWAAKSTDDFATYRAIILGDMNCEDTSLLAAPVANRDTWGPTVSGSVFVVGTHPAFNGHPKWQAATLVRKGIAFATSGATTGAYIMPGCYFSAAPGTAVSVLEPFGRFMAIGQDGCSTDAHVIASHPTLDGTTDADLSNWQLPRGTCDTATGFTGWPSSFSVVAIAKDVSSGFVGPDGVSGSPFILGRGEGLVPALCGDGALNPTEECDDGNNVSGDGCSASCRTEFAAGSPASGKATSFQTTIPEIVPMGMAATATTTLQFSGSASVQNRFLGAALCCVPFNDYGPGARVNLDISANWTPKANVMHQYSPGLLRQGETLDLVDTLTGDLGPLTINYHVFGDYGLYFLQGTPPVFPDAGSEVFFDDTEAVTSFDFSLSAAGTCTLKLDGDGTYGCSATKNIEIVNDFTIIPDIVSISVSVPVTTTLSITPDGVTTVRSVTGAPVRVMTFHGPSPSTLADNFPISCSAPVGSDVLYTLGPSSSDPSASGSTSVSVHVDATVLVVFHPSGDITIGTLGPDPPVVMALTAGPEQTNLGSIQADNRPPIANAGGPYGGGEGDAIHFTSSATTDNCPSTLTYVWNFSDGGIAFGASPFHAFPDNGTYSGQLVVRDGAGNLGIADFSLGIVNLPPVVDAGPDTMSVWGVPVAFNGSATDPGIADQPTLSYRWSFGDGSPSATGGPSVTHPYISPGVFMASFRACDKDWACTSMFRNVTVRKRNTSVGYLGDNSGTFDTDARLSASLVDELSATVPNRPIAFAIGPETAGSPSTDSSGIASQTHRVGLAAGPYSVSALFAGDGLYTPSGAAASFAVSAKATGLTYTGALSGGPNKIVSLSSVLRDSSGTPLGGRVVTFQLGAQSISGTTDASGVASASLHLNQKNATYNLTATFAPAGPDVGHYLGSTATTTFTIQGGG